MKKIGVIGAGAWGTALAVLANRAGSRVTLWTRNQDVQESIADRNQNELYLPGVFLDPEIYVTDNLEQTCRSDILILCVPAQHARTILITIPDYVDRRVILTIACKGIERGSGRLVSEIVQRALPSNPLAVLSGPNFACDVVAGKPTATTIASSNRAVAEQVVFCLGTTFFRPYICTDVIGTQIGGAVKNVMAIACGIALGRGFGENARAAIITRGLAEIQRLTQAKGGRPETVTGLSGLGDMVLTASGSTKDTIQSRNMAFGYALGTGHSLEEAQNLQGGVKEGFYTAESVYELAQKLHVEMPICEAVYRILHQGEMIDRAVLGLLDRPFNME